LIPHLRDYRRPVLCTTAGLRRQTLDDWAKFLNEHIRGANGQSQLASKAIFDRLHTPPPGGSYAAGWDTDSTQSWAGGMTFTHSGSNTLNGSTTWIAPAKGLVLVAVSNAGTDAAFYAIDSAFHPMIERFAQ
jgi:CubicO group peptidase (beta-lactamase class C family)